MAQATLDPKIAHDAQMAFETVRCAVVDALVELGPATPRTIANALSLPEEVVNAILTFESLSAPMVIKGFPFFRMAEGDL